MAGTKNTAPPAPVPSTPSSLSLTLKCEHPNGRPANADTFTAVLATVFANAVPDDVLERSRPPVSLTLVIDSSGSMAGEKLAMVRRTAEWIVGQLSSRDALGVVSYASDVCACLPLRCMDVEGRRAAVIAIRCIQEGGLTNLSGGLFAGLEQQIIEGTVPAPAQVDMKPPAAAVRCVYLFTDGQANRGLTAAEPLARAAAAKVGDQPIAVYTFGFGEDHDECMLQQLTMKGGVYSYLPTADDIPAAFGDALGGLMSTVAQSVRLTFRVSADDGREGVHCGQTVRSGGGDASAAVQIVGVAEGSGLEGAVRTRVSATGSVTLEVNLADLAAEDRRDILVELRLPSEDAEARTLGAGITAELAWVDCIVAAPATTAARISIPRETITSITADASLARNAVDPEVRLQRHRLLVAAALETAAAAGDAGAGATAIQAAVRVMNSARVSIMALTVNSGSEATSDNVTLQQRQLVTDLDEAVEKLENQRERGGRNASKGIRSMRWNHLAQKGSTPVNNVVSTPRAMGGQTAARARSMMSAVTTATTPAQATCVAKDPMEDHHAGITVGGAGGRAGAVVAVHDTVLAAGLDNLNAGYTGKFYTSVVVVMPEGGQGAVLRHAEGVVTIAVGAVKVLPNGDSCLDSVPPNAPVKVFCEGELSLAMPSKNDHVVVVEGAGRGARAELIGVDNDQGVLRMEASKDITIAKMSALARIWTGLEANVVDTRPLRRGRSSAIFASSGTDAVEPGRKMGRFTVYDR